MITPEYARENEDYFAWLVETIRKSKKKACYISFNKSYAYLMETFGGEGINMENIFVVDCINCPYQEA